MIRKTKWIKALALASLFSICLIGFTGCNTKTSSDKSQTKQDYITKSSFKLNTFVTINIYDKQEESLLDGAMQICDYYEKIFSRTSKESELYQFNHGMRNEATDGRNQSTVSKELAEVISQGLHYSAESDGAFDVTVANLSDLWNFSAENPRVPEQSEIDALLPYVNYKDVKVDGTTVTMKDKNMAIDLGAIAKGYIADRIKDYLVSNGVKSATINLGGNVLCVGKKIDGTPFNIGIQKPFADRNEIIATIAVDNLSVVSSGIYERCFTVNGKFYHHILNPKTGYPYDTDLVGITIISEKSVDGDGLSTTCFSLGVEKGLELINSMENVYAVFITSEDEIIYSDGLKENFTITEIK